MGKDSTQKAARQRRRDRQKKLVEVGRQAEDLVSKHRQQATEAMVRVERLEAELAEAWKALGDATIQVFALISRTLGCPARASRSRKKLSRGWDPSPWPMLIM